MPMEPNQAELAVKSPITDLEDNAEFIRRHIGPDDEQINHMLSVLGVDSLEALIESTVPESIHTNEPLALPEAQSEVSTLKRLRGIAGRNTLKHSMIGMGYHDTITPTVILRNILENPGWYTAYTPYQAEISQGRLEAMFMTLHDEFLNKLAVPLIERGRRVSGRKAAKVAERVHVG